MQQPEKTGKEPELELLEESPRDLARRQLAKQQEERQKRLEGHTQRTLKFFESLTPKQRQLIMRELIRGKEP